MHAETAQRFEALESMAAKLRALFIEARFEPVAPAILQPAELLLDCSGETLRARTYVFTDIDGFELCLRPDITVPTARLYIERHPSSYGEARYCYNGPTFRYSPANGKNTKPREFRQMGLELYAMSDRHAADTEIFRLTLEAIELAGLHDYKVQIGDLAIFNALIEAIDMPKRWRARLKHHFWRPDSFHKLLQELSNEEQHKGVHVGDWPALDPQNKMESLEKIASYMQKNKIPLVGSRALGEITNRLLEKEMDTLAPPLSRFTVDLIEDYLAISGPPRAAMARISDLTDKAGINIDRAIKQFNKRLDLFKEREIDLKNIEFNAEFGRSFEYYTGFVFQVEAPDSGEIGPVAGGGRYDKLLQKLGALEKIKAVGCAIHTERLLTVIEGDME